MRQASLLYNAPLQAFVVWCIVGALLQSGMAALIACRGGGTIIALDAPNTAYELRNCDANVPETIRLDADNISLVVFNASVVQTILVGAAGTKARHNVTVNFSHCLLTGSVEVLVSNNVAALHHATVLVEDSRIHLRGPGSMAFLDVDAAVDALHVRILRTAVVLELTGTTGGLFVVRLTGRAEASSILIHNGTIDSNWTHADSAVPFGPFADTIVVQITGGAHSLDVAVVATAMTMEVGYTATVVQAWNLLLTRCTLRIEACRIGMVLRGPRGKVFPDAFPFVLRQGIVVLCPSAGPGSSVVVVDTTVTMVFWHLVAPPDPTAASTAVVDRAIGQLVSFFGEASSVHILRCRLDISVPQSAGGAVGLMTVALFGLMTIYQDSVNTPAVRHCNNLHIVVEASNLTSRFAPTAMCAQQQTTTVEVSPGTSYPIKTTTNGIAIAQGIVLCGESLADTRIEILKSAIDVVTPPLLYLCPHDPGTIFGFNIPKLSPANYTVTAALLIGSVTSIIARIAETMLVVSPLRSALGAMTAQPLSDLLNVTVTIGHTTVAMNGTAQPRARGGGAAANSSLLWSYIWMVHARCSTGVRLDIVEARHPMVGYGAASTARFGPLMVYLDGILLLDNVTATTAHDGSATALTIHIERLSPALPTSATAVTLALGGGILHLPALALLENIAAEDTISSGGSHGVVRIAEVAGNVAVDGGVVLLRNASAPMNWTFTNVAWTSWGGTDAATTLAPLLNNNAAPGLPWMHPPWPNTSHLSARCVVRNGTEIVNASWLFGEALGVDLSSVEEAVQLAPCATPTCTRSVDSMTAHASVSRSAYSQHPSESMELPMSSTLLPNISYLTSLTVPRSPPATIVAAVFTWVSPLARVSAPALQRSMGTVRLVSRCSAIRPPAPSNPHSDPSRVDGDEASLMEDPLDNPMQFDWPSAFISPQLSAVGGGVVGNALFCVIWTVVASLLSMMCTMHGDTTTALAAVASVVDEIPVTLLDVYAPLLQPCVAGGVGAIALAAIGGDVVLGIGTLLMWCAPMVALAVLLLWTFRSTALCPFLFRRNAPVNVTPASAPHEDVDGGEGGSPATSHGAPTHCQHRSACIVPPPAAQAFIARWLQFDATLVLDRSTLRRRHYAVRRAAVHLRHILENYAPNRYCFLLTELSVAILCGVLSGAAWFASSTEACTNITLAVCACLWAYVLAVTALQPYGSRLVNVQSIAVEGLGAVSVTCAVVGDDDSAMVVAIVQLVVAFIGSITNWLRWLMARTLRRAPEEDEAIDDGSSMCRGADWSLGSGRRKTAGRRSKLFLPLQMPAELHRADVAPEDWHRLKLALLHNAATASINGDNVDGTDSVRVHAMLELLIRIAVDLRQATQR